MSIVSTWPLDRFYNGEFFCKNDTPRTAWSLVLDLDETLVHTIIVTMDPQDIANLLSQLKSFDSRRFARLHRRSFFFELVDVGAPKGSGSSHYCWGVFRPHLYEFLAFCHCYFDSVNVWSAGKEDYVHEICAILEQDFPPFRSIYTWDDCVQDSECKYKDLKIMVQKCSHLEHLESLLILDDKSVTFSRNPANGIEVPVYAPCPELKRFSRDQKLDDASKDSILRELLADDQALLKFRDWLCSETPLRSKSVHQLNKNNIFG
jgi:TFIIF-interacting CTD phosphatase-like protein